MIASANGRAWWRDNWLSRIDADYMEQPRELDNETLARAIVGAWDDDAPAFRMVALCQLVALL